MPTTPINNTDFGVKSKGLCKFTFNAKSFNLAFTKQQN